MSLAPLLAAPLVVVLHTLAAVAALVFGAAQLLGPKGAATHRMLGWLWVGLMAATAISSLWISRAPVVAGFGWIHLLSILSLAMLPLAVSAARRGRRREHATRMRWLYFAALVAAGAFTLAPGRIMHAVAFG
ncbi:MAG: DUF2306 domain-containing protein [Rubrimonas sp.]